MKGWHRSKYLTLNKRCELRTGWDGDDRGRMTRVRVGVCVGNERRHDLIPGRKVRG